MEDSKFWTCFGWRHLVQYGLLTHPMRIPLPLRASLAMLIALASCTSGPARAVAAGIPGYVVVPLSLMDKVNQAVVRANVNGRPTMLLMDTGASGTLLDRRFYQKAQVRSNDAAPGQLPPEVGKKVKVNGEPAEVGYVDSLQVGGAEFGKRPVGVLDMSGQFAQYNNMHAGSALGGLLGEDVLRKYSAIIDWARRGVYLNIDPAKRLKLGPGLVAAGWTAIPMYSTEFRHFAVSCTVESQPVRLLVDTGAGFTGIVPDIVPIKHMIYGREAGSSTGHIHSYSIRSSMTGMDSNAYLAKLENWKVGNYEIASSVVTVSKIVPGLLAQQSGGEGPLLGLLGAEVLASNNAIIDVAGSTLYLKPTKH